MVEGEQQEVAGWVVSPSWATVFSSSRSHVLACRPQHEAAPSLTYVPAVAWPALCPKILVKGRGYLINVTQYSMTARAMAWIEFSHKCLPVPMLDG